MCKRKGQRAHKKRNPEVKKEELKRATGIYMDFYYNGIGEKEEEREEEEGVRNDEEEVEGDSPSISLYDSQKSRWHLGSWQAKASQREGRTIGYQRQ